MNIERQAPIVVSQAIYILFASGFAEGDVIACLDPLESIGSSPVLVCPSTRRVRGQHGLTARGAVTLEQAQMMPTPRAILIPGGEESVSSLWADPRAHELVRAALKAGALVGVFGASQPPLSHLAMTLNARGLLFQGDRTAEDFVAALMARLTSGSGPITTPAAAVGSNH